MPIVIKEIFSSDPISEALEKINFNFDQLILSGGGPPGPIGLIGPPGVPGSQGSRGDHWQVGGASSIGFTGPTSDHGPNYGSLQSEDHWTDTNGDIWRWESGPTDAWINTGVNLKGPIGLVGPTGNSTDLNMYLGNTGGANDASSFVPFLGPTTVSAGNANFYVLNNIDINSFLLGDPGWAYNKLINFNNIDLHLGITTSQRMIPKQVIIQSGIDYTGYGGLSIGAFGLTGGTSTSFNDFIGGSSQAGIVDGRSLFNAGWAIDKPGTDYSHVFKIKTAFNNLEISSGDNNTSLGNTDRKLILISGSIEMKGFGSVDGSDIIRFSTGSTYSRFRDLLAIGINTVQVSSTLPNLVAADVPSYPSKLIVNGNTRIAGSLLVGEPNTPNQSINVGYNRTAVGNSYLILYSDSAAPISPSFSITRFQGPNGTSVIDQYGTGNFEIRSILSSIELKASNVATSHISFGNSTTETARIDTSNHRLGVGTIYPSVKVHIKDDGSMLKLEGISSSRMQFDYSGSSHGFLGYTTDPLPVANSDTLRIWNLNGDDIAFGTSNTQHMTIDKIGNVGIGTRSPVGVTNNTLHITGTDNVGNLFLGNNSLKKGFRISSMETGTLVTDPGRLDFTTGKFGDAASKIRMSLLSNGNFGIGITGAAALLHIYGGDLKASLNDYVPLQILESSWNSVSPSVNKDSLELGSFRISPGGFITSTSAFRMQRKRGSNWSSYIQFEADDITFGTGAAASRELVPEKMRITATGNVGIGIKVPTQRLEVIGDWTGATTYGDNFTDSIAFLSRSSSIGGLSIGIDATPILYNGAWIQSIDRSNNVHKLFINPRGGVVVVGDNAEVLRLNGNTTVHTDLYLGGIKKGSIGFTNNTTDLHIKNTTSAGKLILSTTTGTTTTTVAEADYHGLRITKPGFDYLPAYSFLIPDSNTAKYIAYTVAAALYDRVIYVSRAPIATTYSGVIEMEIWIDSNIINYFINAEEGTIAGSDYAGYNMGNFNASYILPAGSISMIKLKTSGSDVAWYRRGGPQGYFMVQSHKLGLN